MKIFALVLSAFLLSPVGAQEKVLLAAEDNWYPYSASAGNQAKGLTVDIVKAAYSAVGVTVVLDVVPFNRGMVRTKEGRYAGVFNAGLNDGVRKDYLIPRNHVVVSEQVVVARIGEPFQSIRSFNGRRLALTLGYTYPDEITGDSRNEIERAYGDVNNLSKIAKGRADFTIIDRLVALAIFAKEPELRQQLAIVGKLGTEKIYVLFAKTDTGRKSMGLFDQGMDQITRNGSLKGITDSWEARLR